MHDRPRDITSEAESTACAVEALYREGKSRSPCGSRPNTASAIGECAASMYRRSRYNASTEDGFPIRIFGISLYRMDIYPRYPKRIAFNAIAVLLIGFAPILGYSNKDTRTTEDLN
jgi:hypothetical protein